MASDEVPAGTPAPVVDPNLQPLAVTTPEFGIDETKRVLKLVIELAKGVDKSLADGKFGVSDLFNFYGALVNAAPALNGLSQIKPELAHLDDVEIADLRGYVANELKLGDQALTDAINRGLSLAQTFYDFVKSLKK